MADRLSTLLGENDKNKKGDRLSQLINNSTTTPIRRVAKTPQVSAPITTTSAKTISAPRNALEALQKGRPTPFDAIGNNVGALKNVTRTTLNEAGAGTLANLSQMGGLAIAKKLQDSDKDFSFKNELSDIVTNWKSDKLKGVGALQQIWNALGNSVDMTTEITNRVNPSYGVVNKLSNKAITNKINKIATQEGVTPDQVANKIINDMMFGITEDFSGYYTRQQNLAQEREQYGKGVQTAGNVAGAIGAMLPAIGVSLATKNPNLGMGILSAAAGGQKGKQVFDQTGNVDKSYNAAVLEAGKEFATEKMFGGVLGLGKGVIPAIGGKALSKSARTAIDGFKATKQGKLLSRVGNVAGESTEEALAQYLESYVDRTYDPNAARATKEEIWEAAKVGGLVSLILGGGSYVVPKVKSLQAKQSSKVEPNISKVEQPQEIARAVAPATEQSLKASGVTNIAFADIGKNIVLEKNGKVILSNQLTHEQAFSKTTANEILKMNPSDMFTKFKKLYTARGVDVDTIKTDYIKRYAEQGEALNQGTATKKLMADTIDAMFLNGNSARRTSKDAPEFAQAIMDNLVQLRDSTNTNSKVGKQKAKELTDLIDYVERNTNNPSQAMESQTTPSVPIGKKIKSKADTAMLYWVNTLNEGRNMSKKLNDPRFIHFGQNALIAQSRAQNAVDGRDASANHWGQQSDYRGKRVGESEAQILDPAISKGKEYWNLFQNYLWHYHNIDRMSLEDKASKVIQVNERFLDNLLKDHPDLQAQITNDYKQTKKKLAEYAKLGEAEERLVNEYLYFANEVAENKKVVNIPVFGKNVTAAMSKDFVEQVELENPEMLDIAKKVWGYNRNNLQLKVDFGSTSKATAEYLNKKYPHYVQVKPDKNMAKTLAGRKLSVPQMIHAAKGMNVSNGAMDIGQAMAVDTMMTYRYGALNKFGNLIFESIQANPRTMEEFATTKLKSLDQGIVPQTQTKAKAEQQEDIDEFTKLFTDVNGAADVLFNDEKKTFTIFVDGKRRTLKVNDNLYFGLKELMPKWQEKNLFIEATRTLNRGFKDLITGMNPVFAGKNWFRDNVESLFMTKNLVAYAPQRLEAPSEIQKNGAFFRRYKAVGGYGQSFLDYNLEREEKSIKSGKMSKVATGASTFNTKVLGRMRAFNMRLEIAPRLTEFMATVKLEIEKVEGKPYKEVLAKVMQEQNLTKDEAADVLIDRVDYNKLLEAAYNAADITVNFPQGGKYAKEINKTFVPFFNPSIQGLYRTVRRFTETKGVRPWLYTIGKGTLLGIIPRLLNDWLWDDDDDYQKMTDRDKNVYYLFHLGEDKWVKIPKARVMSVLGMAAATIQDVAQGEEIGWGEFFSVIGEQIAPASPVENNILMPMVRTQLGVFNRANRDLPGFTWYGSPIDTMGDEDTPYWQRYTASTSAIGKAIGRVLNVSPKKVDVLMDSYGGILTGIVLPLTSKAAENTSIPGVLGKAVHPLTSAFYLDTKYSNKLSKDIYDTIQEYNFKSKLAESEEDKLKYSLIPTYLTSLEQDVGELTGAIRDIQASDLSDKDKREQVDALKTSINFMREQAITGVLAFEDALDNNYFQAQNFAAEFRQREVTSINEDEEMSTQQKQQALEEMDTKTATYQEKWLKIFSYRDAFGAEYALPYIDESVYANAQSANSFDVPYDVYFDYYLATKDLTSDKNIIGKTVPNSLQKKWAAEIKKLPISDEAKARLFCEKYEKSSMYKYGFKYFKD